MFNRLNMYNYTSFGDTLFIQEVVFIQENKV